MKNKKVELTSWVNRAFGICQQLNATEASQSKLLVPLCLPTTRQTTANLDFFCGLLSEALRIPEHTTSIVGWLVDSEVKRIWKVAVVTQQVSLGGGLRKTTKTYDRKWTSGDSKRTHSEYKCRSLSQLSPPTRYPNMDRVGYVS